MDFEERGGIRRTAEIGGGDVEGNLSFKGKAPGVEKRWEFGKMKGPSEEVARLSELF